ncbi:hypothetical protein [Rhodococcus triatomae]|nr:hypothetical protein G419_14294 [Rhodococcus triatomae BKS 15-14]
MTHQIASDRAGRRWAILAIGNSLKGRLLNGEATPAVLDLDELVDLHGPLVMSPTRPAAAGGFAAIADTICLVASDPETASVEQIDQVASFAQAIVRPKRRLRA